MPRPRIEDHPFLTTTDAGKALGVSGETVRVYVVRGIFPSATLERNGLHLFSREWLEQAREVLRKIRKETPDDRREDAPQ